MPVSVHDELAALNAPAMVRSWATHAPEWLEIKPNPDVPNTLQGPKLDFAEQAALALARTLGADLVLMDDRAGVAVARLLGFEAIGTFGILDLAARRGLVDLGSAFARLKATNFRYRPELLDMLLAQFDRRKS